MKKTIMITGATDGIGLATAKTLASEGHNLLIHGRTSEKLSEVKNMLRELKGGGEIHSYLADFSKIKKVKALADTISTEQPNIDVLINNAGVFKTPNTVTQDGLDVRFSVNTIAPYLLTQKLLPILGTTGRVINLSSAAQAPVSISALRGEEKLSDMEAYSQSKLAITMWSFCMAETLKDKGPSIISVNPGSLLSTKMVKEAFGMEGKDINIGANIVVKLSLEEDLRAFNGQYFDNDKGKFSEPHTDGYDLEKSMAVVGVVEVLVSGC